MSKNIDIVDSRMLDFIVQVRMGMTCALLSKYKPTRRAQAFYRSIAPNLH